MRSELRIRAVHVGRSWPSVSPRELTYIRLEGREHELDPARELSLRLPPGSYTVEAQRSSPRGGRCSRSINVAEGEATLATVRLYRDLSSPTGGRLGAECGMVTGRVGVAYATPGRGLWFAAADGRDASCIAAEGESATLSP